jgi:hypothetical protein
MPGWPRCASAASKKRASPDDDTDLAAQLAELTVAEVRALLQVTLPLPAHSPQSRQAWSNWRRHKRWQSRQSYWKRTRPDARSDPPKPVPSQHLNVRLYY